MKKRIVIAGMLMLAIMGCRSSRQSTETLTVSETKKLDASRGRLVVTAMELDSVFMSFPLRDTTGSDTARAVVVKARKVRVNTSSADVSRVVKADSIESVFAKDVTARYHPLPGVTPLVWGLLGLHLFLLLLTIRWILHNRK